MKRLFNHLLQIFVLGCIFFLMIKLPLFKIPHIQEILTSVIVLGLFVLVGILIHFNWIKKKNILKIIIIAFLFLTRAGFASSVTGYTPEYLTTTYTKMGQNIRCSSMNYCSVAEKYDEETFNAKKNNWKGDKPCKNVDQNCVRETLNELKISPSNFVATDKLTSKQKETYRSFRKDSHWAKWVSEHFSPSGTHSAEDLACAAKFASLCSEYERRHPSAKAKTVSEIMKADAEKAGCWPCKMAYIILTVVQDLSSNLESKMQEAALTILKIFFLFWILYMTFFAVVFPSKGETYLKDLMTRLSCVIISAIILSSGDGLRGLYRSGLSPIIGLGLGLTQEVNEAIKMDDAFGEEVYSRVGISSTGTDYCEISTAMGTGNDVFLKKLPQLTGYRNSDAYKKWSESHTSEDNLISPELQVHLLCMTQRMYRQVSPITAVGQSLIGFSLTENKHVIISQISKFLTGFDTPDLKMWSVGFILVALFLIFSFIVAFKIIDIFLRLGFVLVLMPLFVAAWAFPLSRDFTKKGFLFLMNIVTEFLGLALAINFIIVLFETGVVGNKTELIAKMAAPYSKKYGENLLNVVLSNGGWCFFLMMIAISFLGFQILMICSKKLIGGLFGTKAVGGDITGAVAASAVQMTGMLGKKTWDVSSKAAENTQKYKVPKLEKSSSAASKRYFGQQTGEGVKRGSQYLAAGIDKVGVGVGQALSKTGIGAIVGVPLTLGAKTLSLGVRAVGKVGSGVIKTTGRTTGAVAHGIRHPVQTAKNGWTATKTGAQNAWNKVTAGPKKAWRVFKDSFDKGDGK